MEENSTDWIQIGEAYQNSPNSIRSIAKKHGISDTAVRKEAKKRKWQRPTANQVPCEPSREPEREPEERSASRRESEAKSLSYAPVKELTGRGRNIILSLMAELEFLNNHHHLLSELVEIHFDGEKDVRVRAKLEKALDHETRSKTANHLATALAKLNDAAPGKKEQLNDDANEVAAGGDDEFGDDLAVPDGQRFS